MALAAKQLLGHLLLVLICPAHLSVLICRAHLSVRHQKRLYPVMVPLLADPVGNRSGLGRQLQSLAECLGEALQSSAGQTPIDSHPHPVEIDLPPLILARCFAGCCSAEVQAGQQEWIARNLSVLPDQRQDPYARTAFICHHQGSLLNLVGVGQKH